MSILTILLIMAAVFGLCYLIDKGFTKAFRGTVQHQSGKSVRLSKRYATIGIIMFAVGVTAAFMGGNEKDWLLLGGGCILILGGIALVTYYMSFGIYYDEDSLVFSSFGKASTTHYIKNIRCQQLYMAGGNVIVELHMKDRSHFQVHTGMTGMDAFMDHAFAAWLALNGKKQEDCPWYDPQNSCWFPPMED